LPNYYSKLYQGKRYGENNSESFIVPSAIKIMVWIALIVGILGLFSEVEHGSCKFGLGIIASSVFLFGFFMPCAALFAILLTPEMVGRVALGYLIK